MGAVGNNPTRTGHGLETVVRRLYDEVWNAARYEIAKELFHPDFQYGAAPGLHGAEAKLLAIRKYHELTPGARFTIDDIVVGADHVAARTTITFTDTKGWQGRPPTGRTVTAWSAEFFGFRDGRIITDWVGDDWLGLLIQLGVIDNPWTSRTA
jgi:predicted ester cyclase